jgi:hypothetical protein
MCSLTSILIKDIASATAPGEIEMPTRTSSATDNHRSTTTCETRYHIILSGNDAYMGDLLTWWYHCQRVGLCCDPRLSDCCSTTTFYAEDEAIFKKLQHSKILRVKGSWETGTNHNKYNLTGQGRFTYSKKLRFNHMVSRRPSILCNEMMDCDHSAFEKATGPAAANKTMFLFFDLDTFVLQDPRPYFSGDFDFWGQDALNNNTGPFNTGFLAMRPTNGTLQVIREWRRLLERRTFKPSSNQKTFNNIVRSLNTTVHPKLLPVQQFLAGRPYDTADNNVAPLSSEVVVFHNNFCDVGCSKVERAKALGLWHPLEVEAIMG